MKAQTQYRVAMGLVCISILLANTPPLVAAIGPTPIICTSKAYYFTGDTLQATLSGWNFGPQMSVDVYIGVLAATGAYAILGPNGVWSLTLQPCITKWDIQSQSELYGLPIGSLTLPPTAPAGLYLLSAVATKTGSPNPTCDLNIVAFFIESPGGKQYYVDGTNGQDSNPAGTQAAPWKTITHALQSAVPPAAIHVMAGPYSSSTNGETFPLLLKTGVHLRGAGAGVTTLDAQKKAFHVITGAKGADRGMCVVEGFKITGGNAHGPNPEDQQGGGVYCPPFWDIVLQSNIIENNSGAYGAGIYLAGCSPTIHGNTIQKNVASECGGGIACEKNAGGSIVGNSVLGNTAKRGAGIWCSHGKPGVYNNLISGNMANELGGGICCDYSSAVFIASNMIKENEALGNGGPASGAGVYCAEGVTSSTMVMNNAIKGNTASSSESYGGGIACVLGASPTLRDNVILQNKAVGNVAGQGGGIYCQKTVAMKVEDCVIRDNIASSHGGGAHCDCGAPSFVNNVFRSNTASTGHGGGICCDGNCYAALLNNTIVENVALHDSGGGLWVDSTGAPTITDCIVWKNKAAADPQMALPSGVALSYCCVESWTGGGWMIISDDPDFVAGPYGEHYLDAGSPCIDKGSTTAVGLNLDKRTTCVTGQTDTGTVDLGYHYRLP